VQLYKLNYQTTGDSPSAGYGTTKLKDYDPDIWAKITNYFNGWDGDYVRVLITPAPQTNQGASYRGMGALIVGKDTASASIQQNLNGGWGSYEPNFSYSSGINYFDYSLGVGPDESLFFDYNSSGGSRTFESVSTYDTANFFGNGTSLSASPFQADTSTQIGLQYGINNPTFGSSYFTAGDSGYLGNPDWLASAGTGVGDPVNPLTGEFHIDAVDLTLPGPFSLQIRRNYLSQNRGANQFGVGWKWALTPYLVLTNSTQGATNILIYGTEMDGSVVAYHRQDGTDVWKPQASDNPSLNNNNTYGIGSTANMLNARIERAITNSTDVYTLYAPDGGARRYELRSYPIVSGTNNLDRTRPYLTEWRDNRTNALSFIYGQDSSSVDYGQVARIESGNGNYLEFVYDSYGRIVEAFAGDGRRLFYEYDLYGDLITLTLPDETQINYEYEHYNYTNNGAVYRDSDHLLTRELKFDGRQLVNQYDALRRVTNQLATVGADLTPVRNATYYYGNNYNPTNLAPLAGNTLIVDVFGRTNRYDYTNGLITLISDPLNQTIQQQWYADNATAPGYPRSLQLRKDKRGLWTQLQFDERGNVTNMLQFTAPGTDNLTGESASDATTTNAVWTALYTTNNLLQQTTDPASNTVQYAYDATFAWLPATLTKIAAGTPVSTNLMFYYSVTNFVTNGSMVVTQRAIGLLQKEVRGSVATNEWQHDGRGFPILQKRYARTAQDSSNPDPPVVTTFIFNARGEMVEKDDALGRAMRFDFDGLGRPKWTEVFDENGSALARSYSYYNPNGELVWSDGPQFGPEDYVWRDYDGAGRKTTEIVFQSEVLPDGTDVGAAAGDDLFAVTLHEYDAFGNETKTTDPRGNYNLKRYDALGRPTQEEFYGADNFPYTTNKLGYEPGGLVRFSTNGLGAYVETRYTATGLPRFRQNADGSTNGWTYYKDGRVKSEFLVNGSFWTTTYQDAQRKLTRVFKQSDGTPLATNTVEFDTRGNTIRTTDGEGYAFTNSFDGLDRVKIAAGPPTVTIALNEDFVTYTTNVTQQVTTNVYDASGKTNISVNALGEKTIRRFDALGRPTRMDITGTNGVSVRNREFVYTGDNHYVAAYEGTGATETFSESYLDHAGRAVLTVRYPNPDVGDRFARTVRRYDKANNLIVQEEDGEWDTGAGLSGVQLLATNGWTYDGLNRVATETTRDGATTSNQYDAIGSVTNRLLPGGLRRAAAYSTDGRLSNEYVIGSSTDRMGERGYTYYPVGSSFAGMLQTVTDTRGITQTNSYDEWLRPKTVGTAGSQAEYNTTTTFQYDRRSLATQITRSYTNSSIGPSTTVIRSYDGNRLLSSESMALGGGGGYWAGQSWDPAARRKTLGLSPSIPVSWPGLSFAYRADGALTNVTTYGYSVNYTVGDNGLLYSRSDITKTVTYGRDELGRLTNSVIKFGSTTNLTEAMTWRSDNRLLKAVEKRSTFTDTRTYQYAPFSRFLTNEQYYLSSGVTDTESYQFDLSASAGLGVLTAAADWKALTNGLDTLKRPIKGTNNYSRVPASGKAFGAASVSATLNGQPVPVDFTRGNTNGWFYAQLLPQSGTNNLTVTAIHPSGLFTNSATSTFTNNSTSQTVTNLHDAFGNVITRVWRKSSGALVREQDFTWNAFNQLVKVTERDANNSGFNWTAVFDGLGRRVRVTEAQVISNSVSASVSIADSYYDPQVEFLEIGVSYNSRAEMKVYGLDVSGTYGGAQGIGGLEAVIDVINGPKNSVLNDRFGNVLGYAPVLLPSSFQWGAARFNGYGPKVGYETPFLASGVPLVQTLGWQGQRRDVTGLYYWNARPYDPVERRFLTLDPAGVGAMSPYGLCNGDPNYWLDPDGRVGIDPPLIFGLSAGQRTDPQRVSQFYADQARTDLHLGLPLAAAVGVGLLTGGAAAPLFSAAGASTTFTVIGSGLVGGAAGDFAAQTVQIGMGDRSSYSGQQVAFSSLLGGGLNYGANRLLAPRLLSGQMGNAEVGALGEEQAAQDITQAGQNIRAQQMQLRTPEGNPRADFVIDDPSSPSGFRVIEVKTGDAELSYAQTWGYPEVAAGNAVPAGQGAQALGLPAGQTMGPTPVELWRYQPYELLPFGSGQGAAAGAVGGQMLPDGRIFQIDPTGKYVKPR
jgi:RHS repeat-associated protein